MAKPTITLYDIKSKIPGISVSHNTWRVRLVLNFKNLLYERVLSEAPDIAETCIAAGIPPLDTRADGSSHYTFPALVDNTNPDAPVRLCDSRKIIMYLEETYPSSDTRETLFPPGTRAFQALGDGYVEKIINPLSFPLLLIDLAEKLTDRSKPTMQRYCPPGKILEDMNPRGKDREEAWALLRAEFDKIAGYAEGETFISGDRLRYFDIHLLAGLLAIKTAIGDEEFDKDLGFAAGGR